MHGTYQQAPTDLNQSIMNIMDIAIFVAHSNIGVLQKRHIAFKRFKKLRTTSIYIVSSPLSYHSMLHNLQSLKSHYITNTSP